MECRGHTSPKLFPIGKALTRLNQAPPVTARPYAGAKKNDQFLARRHRYGSFLGTYVNMASDTHTQGTHKGIIIVDNLFRNTISKRLFLVLEKLLNPNLKP